MYSMEAIKAMGTTMMVLLSAVFLFIAFAIALFFIIMGKNSVIKKLKADHEKAIGKAIGEKEQLEKDIRRSKNYIRDLKKDLSKRNHLIKEYQQTLTNEVEFRKKIESDYRIMLDSVKKKGN